MDVVVQASSIAQLIGGLIGIIVALYGLMRWTNRHLQDRIVEAIHDATYPISPKANGGLSLPDVARRTECIERDIQGLKGQVDLLVRIYTEEVK